MKKALWRKFFRYFGYDLTYYPFPDWLVLFEHLTYLFAKLQINCVLDVGGHFGEYGSNLRKIGYQGWILSFEPIPANVEKLRVQAAGDSRWKIYPFALGEEESVLPIHVAGATEFSSFLAPTDYSTEHFGRDSIIERIEPVPVKRLDAVLDECLAGIPGPLHLYLKVDTQGYDLPVLRGAAGILDRISGLQSEVSVQPLYNGSTDYLTAMGVMRDLGFAVTGLFPVVRDDDLRVLEFDCVMTRAGAAGAATSGR